MASEDHVSSVRSACVTLDAVQERVDDIDAAILRDAEEILGDYVDGLEADHGD